MDEKIKHFAEIVERDRWQYMREFLAACRFEDVNDDSIRRIHYDASIKVSVKPGKKYTKVDVGTSGKYMVENDSGRIYGIKAYGVIHRGHYYGTLDEVDKRNWKH